MMLLYLYLILRTAATCILRSWGGRRLAGVLERIETPFRGSGGGWWWWVELDYNVSSGPFLSFEIEIGDGPGPELDN